MPAKDKYHDAVVRALLKDSRRIVEEQYKVIVDQRRLWIDIQAARDEQDVTVLVEVKGFENSPSSVETLAEAFGAIFALHCCTQGKPNRLANFSGYTSASL